MVVEWWCGGCAGVVVEVEWCGGGEVVWSGVVEWWWCGGCAGVVVVEVMEVVVVVEVVGVVVVGVERW